MIAPPPRHARPFRLRSRARLVAAITLLQAAVIGLGWFACLHLTRADVSSRSRDRSLADLSRAVEQFNQMVSTVAHGPLRPDTPEWHAAQQLTENERPPRGTVVVLLDARGHILCHPALRRSPNLRNIDFSDVVLTLDPGDDTVALGGVRPRSVLTGESESIAGPASVAVVFNEAAQVRVLAYQPQGEAAAADSRMTSGIMIWGGVAGMTVLTVSLIGLILLVRRYDSMLARSNERLEAKVQRRTRRGLAIRNGLIFGLAKLADYRDTDTGRHLERISRYCGLLAEELRGKESEIDAAWIERLKLASSLHDIGKVGIPDSILLKPGPLTAEERRQMERHASIGADTLAAIQGRVGEDELLNMGVQVARSHHERHDGRGYPHGLRGADVPLAARIVALADMYDALTSHRVYRAAMTHEEAAALIRQQRGAHFHPAIADAFERCQGRCDEARREFQAGAEGGVRLRLRAAA